MHVFMAGATGVLGRRLVAELAREGHEVYGLSRSPRGDELVRAAGGEPCRGDVLDYESLCMAAAGADVIVNAATAAPKTRDPTSEDWARNDEVRRQGTQNLTALASRVGADQYVHQSIVWVARREDGGPFSEEDDWNPTPHTQAEADAERLAIDARMAFGYDVTILRCGWLYAPEATHTQLIAQGLLAGEMPIIGSGLFGRGDAHLSCLHAEDAARAFTTVIDRRTDGLWHVVDDEAVTTANYLMEFARLLGASKPRRVPAWLAKYTTGTDAARFFSHSMQTTNEPFCEETGWRPHYGSYRDGLSQVVRDWEQDGTLNERHGSAEWAGEKAESVLWRTA
ncbi:MULTISPECIES: NAD(P)-dependent oxidoreductase [unclassified Haladaptatus]|uniref:NAD-dependent epimerase/dehydratase family protein n=1 Tax=unclassified Haladaptatus TaxID=2622732 RepID=UPI0023E7F13B|nr:MULTISPECIES: NAD(P)-dependent oxidoreductase [unclassified Haladaptatus]